MGRRVRSREGGATDGASPANDIRGKAIDAIIGRVNAKLGKGSATILTDSKLFSHVTDYISTQSYALDFAMHLPGLPIGRIVTILGAEASGKTTLACHILAETQRRGGIGVLLDTEMAFDEDRAAKIGIDPAALIVQQPETLEDATAEIMETVTAITETAEAEGDTPLVTIVLDSVAGLPSKQEIDSEPDAFVVGSHARAISAMLRRVTPMIARQKILLVFINQEKERIGGFSSWSKAPAKTMIGEHPLGFHSSVILHCKQIDILKRKRNSREEPYAIRAMVRVKKNKKAAPFSEAEVVIRFDTGIDKLQSILSVAFALDIVVKDKGWCKYGDKRFRDSQFGAILEENPGIMEALEKARNEMSFVSDEDEDAD